jgi:phage shock protein C
VNRRLYRSRTDAVWTGVAGGLAEWLGWDPALVRVAWVIATFVTAGFALLVYVVMWVVVPEAPEGGAAASEAPGGRAATAGAPGQAAADRPAPSAAADRGPLWLGLVLVAAGIFFLVQELLPEIDWGRLWPVVLVVVGAVLLIGALRPRA